MAFGLAPRTGLAERLFGGLGRFIIRHPWYPIIFWVALLLVTAPFLTRVGSVTDNSATTLPSSAPSMVASTKIAELFPNTSVASDTIVLLVGPDILGPTGQSSVLALTRALQNGSNLSEVAGVDSLYSAYSSYLAGQTEIALGLLAQGLHSDPSVLADVNSSSQLLWGPPAEFLQEWEAYGADHPTDPPSSWNYPAYDATVSALAGEPTARLVLSTFYSGPNSSANGFNGSADCAASPSSVLGCSDATARANLAPLIPQLVPNPGEQMAPRLVLGMLGIENFSGSDGLRNVTSTLLGLEGGLPAAFVRGVWEEFPTLSPSPLEVSAWANEVVAGPSSGYPLAVPNSIEGQFVSTTGDAEIIIVTFTVGSGYTDAQGNDPVYQDVANINRIGPSTLAATDPGRTLSFYQTGDAPLDSTETQVLNSSLAIVLPLTVIVLITITMLYFRTPLAPILTFTGLGIALALGVGAVVLIGSFLTHVDVTSIELEETFVLGVGTDYSIFLVARYREELHRGVESTEAVLTSVTWAGQSVATSGATAILATLALAFSGVTLLSQWGMVLSVAILGTVLICLTMVPAFLVLLGRRVFWPYVGDRFEAHAATVRERTRTERTYFYRAGRASQRRPKTLLALILLVSIPLLYVAANVPLSYDFYAQLPSDQPATEGLHQLGNHFGQGYAFPIQALVTFRAPLLVGNATNGTEFTDLAELTSTFSNTSGIGAVSSPVGTGNPGLPAWLNFSTLPIAPQENLRGLLQNYLGSDGRSVLLTIVPSSSGLSYAAVALLGTLGSEFQSFELAHPGATAVYFAGGAPITHDLEQQTLLATERMVLAVAIGLILVLFVVLRSWIIPLLAVVSIGLSLAWAWGISYLVLTQFGGIPLFFFVPTILFIVILGLGIDYNIFLLTRVREERLKGYRASESAVRAIASTGGIITAAAVILASAFAMLTVGQFLLLRSIGFAVAVAVLLDAMVVRTYLVPSALQMLGERVWAIAPFRKPPPIRTANGGSEPSEDAPGPVRGT